MRFFVTPCHASCVHVSTKNMLIHEYMELGVKFVEMTLERLPVVSLCPKFR